MVTTGKVSSSREEDKRGGGGVQCKPRATKRVSFDGGEGPGGIVTMCKVKYRVSIAKQANWQHEI